MYIPPETNYDEISIAPKRVKKRRKVKRPPKKEGEEGAAKPEGKEQKKVRIIETEEEAIAY